ncbi:MAG: zinc metallopeptidase [Clostridiaceae bacterium]|nr:zinc metallopeptidase [Clostridiaceae bacterium]
MKWQGRRQSRNVRRGRSRGGRASRGMIPFPAGRIGGTGLIIIIVLVLIFGGDFLSSGRSESRNNVGTYENASETITPENELEAFLSVVLADTEDVWHEVFAVYGERYREPTLTLYSGSVQSGCGFASSDLGPFYCPADENIYIDPSFYYELKNKFDASGDFAFAYVLAHEVGHHVQKLMGTTDYVFAKQDQLSEKEFNQYLIRLELQADYYAGVFAHYVQNKGYLEIGDIEEAMNAAAGVGDDAIQRKAIGKVIPDQFTHGTSEQRMRWFERGYRYGDLEHGDTFTAHELFVNDWDDIGWYSDFATAA